MNVIYTNCTLYAFLYAFGRLTTAIIPTHTLATSRQLNVLHRLWTDTLCLQLAPTIRTWVSIARDMGLQLVSQGDMSLQLVSQEDMGPQPVSVGPTASLTRKHWSTASLTRGHESTASLTRGHGSTATLRGSTASLTRGHGSTASLRGSAASYTRGGKEIRRKMSCSVYKLYLCS